MHDIHGTEKGCYDRLRWYCRAIQKTNPSSVAECEIDPVLRSYPKHNKKALLFGTRAATPDWGCLAGGSHRHLASKPPLPPSLFHSILFGVLAVVTRGMHTSAALPSCRQLRPPQMGASFFAPSFCHRQVQGGTPPSPQQIVASPLRCFFCQQPGKSGEAGSIRYLFALSSSSCP
ncbi:hypothetical protein ZIOFF_071601 [Zingiber officinale]|uniref:Uncharacterized protein n=1 Tax=Zingiber officinale TaxID=94328 RepID=A0A8J5C1P3_ZINOF|nr:hypothetical protein ZIOFF_071601 [Zingiber officinale]